MATMTSEDYYKNLKNEAYTTMLDSEIQASIARDQAMKYTQNQINASGYGQQGLAQSSMLGVQNNYRNALRDAQAQYETNLNNINQQQRNEELVLQQQNEQNAITNDNNNFQTISTLLSAATSQSQLDNIYKEYENDESLSDASKKQLRLLYGMYSDGFTQAQTPNTQQFTLEDTVTVTNKNGKVEAVSMPAQFGYESTTLRNAINTGKVENDSIVLLENGNGLKLYARYFNGTLSYATEEQYNEAKKNKKAYLVKYRDNIKQA